jgi:hypothetical protein
MAIALRSEFQDRDPQQSTQSKPNELRLIPYVEINGTRTLPDSFIEDVFAEMIVEGLVSSVFSMTLVKDGGDFLKMMKNPNNVPVFVLSGNRCIGFAWLNNVGVTNAFGHFCYLPNPDFTAVEFGQKDMDYWWSLKGTKDYALDVLLGSVPAFNQRAVAFVQKFGFVKLGEIPNLFVNPMTGEKWAAVILYCLRPS